MTVLVTGANGFVGSALAATLNDRGWAVRGAMRGEQSGNRSPYPCVPVGAVHGGTDWSRALAGAESVVHLVARTHVTTEPGTGNLDAYRRVNVEGTRRLAEQAVEAGVKRLVFVSSVKVNGELTHEHTFTAHDTPAPSDAYGLSKWEAEQALWELADRTGLEVVVARPPLVYGPGVKANFARLMDWVRSGLPLPFGAVDNRRSMVALPNLVDVLVRCLETSAAAGHTFMVSDGMDVSTPGLIRRIAEAMGRRSRLVPVPVKVLEFAGSLTGRLGEVRRLCGSLQVDIEAAREILVWEPPVDVDRAIDDTVSAYLKHTGAT